MFCINFRSFLLFFPIFSQTFVVVSLPLRSSLSLQKILFKSIPFKISCYGRKTVKVSAVILPRLLQTPSPIIQFFCDMTVYSWMRNFRRFGETEFLRFGGWAVLLFILFDPEGQGTTTFWTFGEYASNETSSLLRRIASSGPQLWNPQTSFSARPHITWKWKAPQADTPTHVSIHMYHVLCLKVHRLRHGASRPRVG